MTQHFPRLAQNRQLRPCVWVPPGVMDACRERNGSNFFFFFSFNSSALGWRQQLEMALPGQGCRELGLVYDGPKKDERK